MTLRIIDIETTGTDPATDHIIEIASVDLTKDKLLTGTKQVLIDPGCPIPPQASAVHHIIDADVKGQATLADGVASFLGASAYVAHNAAFEQSFLGRHIPDAMWVCTYKAALRVWPDAPSHSNQVLRYWLGHHQPFGIERQDIAPHRALSDVIVTASILVDLLRKARWSDLVAWSREPPLLPRMPFGKHRGERFEDLPDDYVDWLLKQSEMDEGVRFTIEMTRSKGDAVNA